MNPEEYDKYYVFISKKQKQRKYKKINLNTGKKDK